MQRTLALDTPKKVGKKVSLLGWVNRRRDHGKLVFIDLRDRSGIVQVVGGEELGELHPECVIEVVGKVRKRPKNLINPKLLTGKVEVGAEEIKILARADSLPFDTGVEELDLELPTLLDHRALTLRHPKVRAIFRVQEVIIAEFRAVLKELGFAEFQAPTIVPVATEGGAEIFPVKYFDYTAYLAQSPQLYKQILVGVFERVFTLAHAYRAEPSVTTRHITEYLSLDAEMGFIESWEEIMDVAEEVVKKIFAAIEKECQAELAMYQAKLPRVSRKIPRIKMREAQQIIFERTGRNNRQEPDLTPEDEREICKWAEEKRGSELVFITHFPTAKRPFYTYADPEDPDFTLSFDLLGRGLEWVTGGQRINDYSQLLANVKKWGNDSRDFELYLEAFKYGMPPEGGFALGAERVTMQILGLENIREASFFPRDMERVDVRLSGLRTRRKKKSASEKR